MIPLEEAQRRVLARCEPLHPRAVPLQDALGLVTSVAVEAEEPVPPFANTAMDGFAVRASDTEGAPVRLRVVADLAAGSDPAGIVVRPGEAVRIMTGAPVPDGADAIVMVEDTEPGGDGTVIVRVGVTRGRHVRPAGEDLVPGQEIFPAFTPLFPGHLAVLASTGLRRVPVFPRARVGVASTGDELVDDGSPLRPGQIRDANRYALLGLVAEVGAEPVDLGVVRDDEAAVREVLEHALEACDVLLTSGGVSMGDLDYVRKVLDDVADEAGTTWMQVAIKPAKPLSFATVGGKPVLGLPGNPASSIVSFELFARPVLLRLMGHREPFRRRVRAVADEGLLRAPDGKLHLVRVVATAGDDGRFRVRSAGGQASNLLRSMALADALAFVPDGDGIPPGGEVEVMLLR